MGVGTNLTVWLGGASDELTPTTDLFIGTRASEVVLADVNHDGRLDAIVARAGFGADPGGVSVLIGNGNATFQAAQSFPAFQPPTHTVAGADPIDIDAADFNGDGRMDLAVANEGIFSGTPSVSVLVGAGGGAFAAPSTLGAGNRPVLVLARDLNADARPDLLVVDKGASPSDPGGIFVFLGNGDGTFQPPNRLDAGLNPTSIAVGDLNADGQPDIAVTTQGPSFGFFYGVLLGSGGGSFRPITLFPTGFGPSHVAIADVTQDGRQDLVVAYCCGATDVALIPGNGDGTFQAEEHFPAGANPFRIGIADFNADGLPDLAVVNAVASNLAGGVSVLLQNTGGGAGSPGGPGGAVCRGVPATIAGTDGPDILSGTAAGDVIAGLAGNDRITDGGGNDLLCGDAGNDTLSGGGGNDRLFGAAGRDILKGGGGRDRLDGGSGRDRLAGGGGRDRCKGGSGRDRQSGCERASGVP